MPEQQASPTTAQPRATSGDDSADSDDASPPPSVNSAHWKRTYLSLLPPSGLIELLLSIDANRDTPIFPDNLQVAIESLKRQPSNSANPEPRPPPSSSLPSSSLPKPPADTTTTVVVKTEPVQGAIPAAPPSTQHAVQPPQYKPPPHKMMPHMYPYPYYGHGYVPSPSGSNPGPPRHPLFTTTPLVRDANGRTVLPPPPPFVISRDDPNAMPSYEEMIVEAITDVGEADGTAPKVLFAWMASHYPLQQNFRPSASQALHKALRRGRLEKIGGKYRMNPSWGGGPTTSKRATRRPTANQTMSPPAAAPGAPGSSGSQPPSSIPRSYPAPAHLYQPYPHHHPSLPPPYAAWAPGQPPPSVLPQSQPPPPPPPNAVSKTCDMEEDEIEIEDMDIDADNTPQPEEEEAEEDPARIKERIRRSLLYLANVLSRFAEKGEAAEEV